MTCITCRLTARNRDQLRNPSLGNQVWLPLAFDVYAAGNIDCCCLFALKDMAVCYHRSSPVLSDLSSSELPLLHIDVPNIAASSTQLPVTTAMMTPPSSQKNSCTKSVSIPEDDSEYGQV